MPYFFRNGCRSEVFAHHLRLETVIDRQNDLP